MRAAGRDDPAGVAWRAGCPRASAYTSRGRAGSNQPLMV